MNREARKHIFTDISILLFCWFGYQFNYLILEDAKLFVGTFTYIMYDHYHFTREMLIDLLTGGIVVLTSVGLASWPSITFFLKSSHSSWNKKEGSDVDLIQDGENTRKYATKHFLLQNLQLTGRESFMILLIK